VKSLEAGRYRITVTDRSTKSGFTLERPKGAAVSVTGTAFVGKHTKTVSLAAGRWLFSAGSPDKATTVVVS
jgi:hypothetical protein